MKIVESRQKALTRLALALSDMDSYRGRSGESIELIWPYCSSDAILVYRITESDNLTVVSSWGRLTPHQTSNYYRYNINESVYAELLKGDMIDIVQAHNMGCTLPALQEQGIQSALIFPITAMGRLEGMVIFISYTSDVWPSDTIEWISIVIAMVTGSIRRTVAGEALQKQLEWRDKIYPIIAHDLRSSAASTKMLLEAINICEFFSHPEQTEIINMARKSSAETFMLLDNLLKWSRVIIKGVVQPQMECVDFIEKIKNIEEYFYPIASVKSIQLTTIYPPDAFSTKMDVDMIATAVRNLLSNAIKFTSPNGEVILEVTLHEASITVSVTDSGVGMDEQQLKAIKDGVGYFSTTGTSGESGTGLGLSLVREFVAAHGGHVSIESIPEVGSKFEFSIPQLK